MKTVEDLKGQVRQLVQHRVVHNALLMYAVQFSSYLFPLLTLPYLSRVLSPGKFGLISFAQMFVWYFVILTEYGFNLTATREVAVSRESKEKLNRIFGAVMSAKLILAGGGLVVLLVVAQLVEKLRVDLDLYLVAFLGVLGSTIFPLWLYQGMEKMGQVAIRDFAAKGLSLVVLFLFVRGDEDYLLAAGAQSGSMLLSGLVGLWRVRGLGVRFEMPTLAEIAGQFRKGWAPFAGLAAVSTAGITNIVALGFWSTPVEVAYYSGAQRIIIAFRSLVSPISSALYPYASQKAAKSERDSIAFVKRYAWILAAPFLASGVIMLVAGPVVLPWFLGAKYKESATVLQIMSFVPALFAFSLIYSTYYMLACGYDKEWMRITVIVTVVNLTLMVGLLSAMRGSHAIAWTGLLTEAVATMLYFRFYRKKSRELASSS